jgi:hypothetical protein
MNGQAWPRRGVLLRVTALVLAVSGLILLVRRHYQSEVFILLDKEASAAPAEFRKNPDFLSPYLATENKAQLKQTVLGRSKNLSPKESSCHYVNETRSTITYYCRHFFEASSLAIPKYTSIKLGRNWIPRYQQDKDRLVLHVLPVDHAALPSDRAINEEPPGHRQPMNVLSHGAEDNPEEIRVSATATGYSLLLQPPVTRFSLTAILALTLCIASLWILLQYYRKNDSGRARKVPAGLMAGLLFAAGILMLELIALLATASLPAGYPSWRELAIVRLALNSLDKAKVMLTTRNKFRHDLRDLAWRQTYVEHGQPVPPGGRREEWNGQKLTFKRPCKDVSICWSAINNPAIFIDENGYQYSQSCRPREADRADVLVVGGSVAEGAHASTTERTWWNQLDRTLTTLRGTPTCVVVFALGGAKSEWEFQATRSFLKQFQPKLVISMSGLNDLVNHGTDDGNKLAQYSLDYLSNTFNMARLAESKGAVFVHAFQPALFDKQNLTPIERSLLPGYVKTAGYDADAPKRVFGPHLDRIATAASRAAWLDRNYIFIDLRHVTSSSHKTLFADLWHFQDPLHEHLGRVLAHRIWAQHRF